MGNTHTSIYPPSSQGPYPSTISTIFIFLIYFIIYFSNLTVLLFILFNIQSIIIIPSLIISRCLLCDYDVDGDWSDRC